MIDNYTPAYFVDRDGRHYFDIDFPDEPWFEGHRTLGSMMYEVWCAIPDSVKQFWGIPCV